jgi:hypothetical protein
MKVPAFLAPKDFTPESSLQMKHVQRIGHIPQPSLEVTKMMIGK